jgi:hypothetical protein
VSLSLAYLVAYLPCMHGFPKFTIVRAWFQWQAPECIPSLDNFSNSTTRRSCTSLSSAQALQQSASRTLLQQGLPVRKGWTIARHCCFGTRNTRRLREFRRLTRYAPPTLDPQALPFYSGPSTMELCVECIQGWATQECHFGWPACIGLGSAPEAMPFCRRLVCECLGTPIPPSRQIGIFGSLWGGSENRRVLGVFGYFKQHKNKQNLMQRIHSKF